MGKLRVYTKWLTPGIGVKRWLLLLLAGLILTATGATFGVLRVYDSAALRATLFNREWLEIVVMVAGGLALAGVGLVKLSHALLAPYRAARTGAVVDVMYAHSKRHRGTRVVAIGGGTGLPSVLRGLKAYTSNLTAVVTVADDGGSSGRLRRDMGVLPPGDLRNNIAALADDESLMTQLFQYRFSGGDLGGHAFGNLFISALSGVTGSLETALVETARVLNIQGRVLPATMDDVTLAADVQLADGKTVHITGESRIGAAGGQIGRVALEPADVIAYGGSVQAILDADIVVIGPGSLFTSILPNLLVKGIAEALRATDAHKVYVCNVAMQPGETDTFTVAEHVLALERHIGRGMFQTVLANDVYPELDAVSINTRYVQPAPPYHEILQRYDVRYTDLVDPNRPWRHDPSKLAGAILSLREGERTGMPVPGATFAHE